MRDLPSGPQLDWDPKPNPIPLVEGEGSPVYGEPSPEAAGEGEV